MGLNGRLYRRLVRWACPVLIFLIVRGGFILTHNESLNDDPDAYRVIAETLARTGVFGLPESDGEARPTAFRPPLYPWMLSWLVDGTGKLQNFPIAILQPAARWADDRTDVGHRPPFVIQRGRNNCGRIGADRSDSAVAIRPCDDRDHGHGVGGDGLVVVGGEDLPTS